MSRPKALTNDEHKQLQAIVQRTSIRSLLYACLRIVQTEIEACRRMKCSNLVEVYTEIRRSLEDSVGSIVE